MPFRLFLIASFLVLVASCSKDATPTKEVSSTKSSTAIRLSKAAVGLPAGHQPWVAHVRSVDLDGDGLLDAIVCEAKDDTVSWLRQVAPGEFVESVIADDMSAPVHAEAVDLDEDGDLDVLVSCMSIVFPNNDKIGALIALENDGQQQFSKRILLENVDRVTDARAGDLDGDGDLDLAVGQFGYDQGEVRWMERTGPWEFRSENLLSLSGAINVCLADFDGDGNLDIAAQISQQWEEIHMFYNTGGGVFEGSVVWGSTNEDFASSGMRICDLNQDGKPDLLFSNGDGFGPSVLPGPRPWHGVQWLENRGGREFDFHRIGNLAGAYGPVAVDMDGDGDQDVLALSSFNDWSDPHSDSMVWFENQGDHRYAKHVLATEPTHLLTVDFGNFDGSGQLSFITGGFHAYPPYDRISRLLLWKRSSDQ